jgi:hypothetical protein
MESLCEKNVLNKEAPAIFKAAFTQAKFAAFSLAKVPTKVTKALHTLDPCATS